MAEKWGISRVGKLEVEVGKHCRKLLFGFKSCRYPPSPGRIASCKRCEGIKVTITGTETHPDKIEAVARPAEVEDVVEKIDPAIENANKYVTRVVHSRQKKRT